MTRGGAEQPAEPFGVDAATRPRVTIAHDFAEAYGGAERFLGAVAETYPEAELWAILGRRAVAERIGVAGRFRTLLPEWEPLLRHYRLLAPLYPALVRARPLPEAEVLVTSHYAFATGYRTRNRAPQLCFCHSPLRFAWSMTSGYGAELGRAATYPLRGLAAAMRAIDRRAAERVTRFVAASEYVARQIREFYGRESRVIRPPVDTDLFRVGGGGHEGYYLFCGRLVEAYKRPSLAIEAFRSLDSRLVVVGDGPALPALRAAAPPNVEFTGHLSDPELIPLMQRCAALVFPSRDDFGLLPLEVMACGRPVLAYAAGGALETVAPGVSGELFGEQSSRALLRALSEFDPDRYDPAAIRAHAEGFGLAPFREAMRAEVAAAAAGERR